MKGIVFTEFLDMVDSVYSPVVVDDIIDSSDLASAGSYTAVGTYPRTEMTALVGALSERVDTPAPDLLRAYGQHLFGRFHALYPGFFTNDPDVLDFLEGIEAVVHSEVLKLYPDAELPEIAATRMSPDVVELDYTSPRCLADLAEGLLRGALADFGSQAELTRLDLSDDGSHSRFVVSRRQP